jgi:hypothetical protein
MSGKALAMLTAVCLVGAAAGTRADEPAEEATLPAEFQRLVPLHTPLGEPRPGDWLAEHPEPGQTFRQYVQGHPVKPDRRRRVIYVQPLGEFTETQRKIIARTAELLGIYFGLPDFGQGIAHAAGMPAGDLQDFCRVPDNVVGTYNLKPERANSHGPPADLAVPDKEPWGEGLVADVDPACRVDQETEHVLFPGIQPGGAVVSFHGELLAGVSESGQVPGPSSPRIVSCGNGSRADCSPSINRSHSLPARTPTYDSSDWAKAEAFSTCNL